MGLWDDTQSAKPTLAIVDTNKTTGTITTSIWDKITPENKNVLYEQPVPAKPEFALCMIHQELVSMEWAMMFRLMQLPSHYYYFSRKAPYDVAREETVNGAMSQDPKYMFFLDSDTKPLAPDSVMHLIKLSEENNIDILSGFYWAKKDQKQPCAWRVLRYEGKQPKIWPIDITQENIERKDIIKCDVTGLGFCLIRGTVFKRWRERWQDWKGKGTNRPFFRWGMGLQDWELDALGIKSTSEDFNFFLGCHELGIYPHVAVEVICDHIAWAKLDAPTGNYRLLEY